MQFVREPDPDPGQHQQVPVAPRRSSEILPEDAYSREWRDGLLNHARYIVVAFLLLGVVLMLTPLARTFEMRIAGGALFGLSILALWLTRPGRPRRVRSVIACTIMFLAAVAFYPVLGFNPGVVVGVAFCIVMTALLMGRRAVLVMLAGFAIYLAALSTALWLGYWSGPVQIEMDATQPIVWIRTSIVSIFFWSAIAVSVLKVLDLLESNSRRRQIALEEKAALLNRLLEEEAHRRQLEQKAGEVRKMEALGHLAAGAAHDFNNALQVIRGWTGMIESGTGDREQALAHIIDASDQAERLVRQLLEFGVSHAVETRSIEIDPLVAEVAEGLSALLPSGVELECELAAGAEVYADHDHLKQVFTNLVINARDALPDGGNIAIRTRVTDQLDGLPEEAAGSNRRWVVIEVQDNGVGMTEEQCQRVFEPFYTTKPRGKGSGMGLSTAYRIVRQFDGYLLVQSRPGEGSLFSVVLPQNADRSTEAA